MAYRSFTFDGINSLTYGVYITGSGVYDAPARVVEKISVPGRNGDLLIDQGRFENVILEYPAGAFGEDQEDFASKMRTIRNLLCSRHGYCRLTDEYNPDEFRLAAYLSGLEIKPVSFQRAAEFTLAFDCKPQRFLLSGETEQTFTSNGTVSNPTAFEARPLLVVTGYGNLTIGSDALTIMDGGSGAAQVLYIDCEAQEAWELVGGAKVSRNDYIQYATGEFPVLKAGTNTVALSGHISRVKITPRWWRI